MGLASIGHAMSLKPGCRRCFAWHDNSLAVGGADLCGSS
jgi:hypothetical protein